MAIYQRHTPESTALYQTVACVWPGLRAEYAASDAPIAGHVETEFERYLRCGILQYGFVKLKCTACEQTRLLGFSCKRRGFCASCGARRMEQTALRLEREVWPVANARQFVLTFPHQVRGWLAHSPELLAEVILVVTDVIKEFYEDSILLDSEQDSVSMPTHGAITFVQRFASSLALNPHLHFIALDGAFAQTAKGKRFYPVHYFDTESVLAILHGICHWTCVAISQARYNKTRVINDIVFQTKLLSFNASVEAARAGEHGKGFAVVAEEVGNLAPMSGNAAKEISTMLEGSIQKVERIVEQSKTKVSLLLQYRKDTVDKGIRTAEECDRVLDDILANVSRVNQMVAEISTASQEQAMGVQEVTKSMNQLDQVTQQNLGVAQQSSTSAEHLNGRSEGLKRVSFELLDLIGTQKTKTAETQTQVSNVTALNPRSSSVMKAAKKKRA